MRIIRCTKHGRVEGFFCRLCRAEKYIEKVRTGEIQPKPLIENEERLKTEPSPLQIRFRAYQERTKKAQLKKPYCWEQRSRDVRIIPTRHLGDFK